MNNLKSLILALCFGLITGIVHARNIDGIDVSRYQEDIKWDEVAAVYPDLFVYIKATEGSDLIDPYYKKNIKGARKNNLKVGSYHYLTMLSSVHDQFKNFKKTVELSKQDLIPMIDVEDKYESTYSQVHDRLLVMLRLVENHFGVKPIIYTGENFYRNIYSESLRGYKTYIAKYRNNRPILPGPNSHHYSVWQYTEKGKIPGITGDVDLCCFHRTIKLNDILMPDNSASRSTESGGGSSKNVSVEKRNGLIIYTPNYSRIDLAVETVPSSNDKGVLMVCGAAFTGQKLSEFSHSNIAGDHVSGGNMYNGYNAQSNTGVFAWYEDGTWTFTMDNCEECIWAATEQNGMAFGQSMLIYKGAIQPTSVQSSGYRTRYRALAELNGRICIIDSDGVIAFSKFVDALAQVGVRHALYLPRGEGWNYSFYRDSRGKVQFIHKQRNPYATNWITFYK